MSAAIVVCSPVVTVGVGVDTAATVVVVVAVVVVVVVVVVPPPPPPPALPPLLPPLPPPALQNDEDGVTITEVVAASPGAETIINCWPPLHESCVIQEAAASTESEGALIEILEAGPMRMVNVLVSTVVDARIAPLPAILTVIPPTVRLELLAVNVTSLKLVAADAASGSNSAAVETIAEVRSFFMRVR